MKTNRRTFLQAAAAALASTVKRASAQSPSANAISMGFSLYGMRSLPLGRALEVCADTGYDGVELVCTKDWPCDPDLLSAPARRRLRRRLTDLDLQISGFMENLALVADADRHRDNLDRLRRAAELGHQLGQERPVIETVLGGRPNQWEQLKQQMVQALGDWAAAAEKDEAVIAIKAHVGGALHTPEDARWLVEEVDRPGIRLAYDFSHFQRQGFELEASLQKMIERSVFIHVKDNRTTDGKTEFALPGEGAIDYVRYVALLKRLSYSGPVVVEVSSQVFRKPDYDPIAAARRSYRTLHAAWVENGLRANA